MRVAILHGFHSGFRDELIGMRHRIPRAACLCIAPSSQGLFLAYVFVAEGIALGMHYFKEGVDGMGTHIAGTVYGTGWQDGLEGRV